MENIGRDLLIKRLRDRLNSDKIKLWLPPYTQENKERGVVPEELILKYSQELSLSPDVIADGLEDLRLRALSKLEEREKFQRQGIATLRIKLTGLLPQGNPTREAFPLECSLSITGADLKTLIANHRGIQASLLKLISHGRIVDENTCLNEQGIANGTDVMAMLMSSSDQQIAAKEAELMEVEHTRHAAELLSSREDDDEDFDIQIADQTGKPLALPKEEKKALTVAMTFHEKGRAALKQKKISLALPLLLEADAEFSKCRSELLQATDNYAILCLDIVWCYLSLKNLDQLPDAEIRLKNSEACFKRCYGEKMERLASIKAEFVLTLLHVDETQLNEVMLMGFTEREARLGLRAKSGNVAQAVNYIMEARKKTEEANKHAKKDWDRRVQTKKLGKTAGGEPVNVDHYDSLVDMEFPPGAAAEALRLANNDLSAAIEILNTTPELRNLPDPEDVRHVMITDEMLMQVTSLGFDLEVAKQALKQYRGHIQRAVDVLLKSGGILPPPPASNSSTSVSESSASAGSSSSEMSSPEAGTSHRLKQEEKEALNSFVSDINTDTDDHLDLTLSEEREILNLYQGMLKSLPI
ncbi:hypothetical protein BsWGS_24873 [Bradybaena similaris]